MLQHNKPLLQHDKLSLPSFCAGGATRCSITEEVRRRAAQQPLNDPELLVGWDVLVLPNRTRVGSIEEVWHCSSKGVTGWAADYLCRVCPD